MDNEIKITYTPPDLIQRMQAYPAQMAKETDRAMTETLLAVESSIPSYPPAPPTSKYIRTMTLGRSLTTGGQYNVSSKKPLGGADFEAFFGTTVFYAERVIGPAQKLPWKKYWWTIYKVAKLATPKIDKVFKAAMERMAAYLNGR